MGKGNLSASRYLNGCYPVGVPMLRFVLRDGLEATEQDVRETKSASRILRWYHSKRNVPR